MRENERLLKGVGMQPRLHDHGLKMGGPRRQRYMGRARLYTLNKALTFLKDLTAGDVHCATALGNERPRQPKKRRYTPLSIAYLSGGSK